MTGAQYIAEFLARHCARDVFLLTGGACAFLVDAVARHPEMRYFCFHHEQGAALAADAVWRVDRTIGATMATSGPGATNLLTGIACSYFDSIPAIHITGQVNQRETQAYRGAKVRQAGFQETKIVEMARPITKYAVQVNDAESLREELAKAVHIATTGRRGPVLIDVPINVQQMEVGEEIETLDAAIAKVPDVRMLTDAARRINSLLVDAQRPLVLFGAGVGLAGAERPLIAWLKLHHVPFVASWNGMTYFEHDLSSYIGQIGVYGNRGANFVLQNADMLLVLGSRLDNRQRSGNAKNFAPGARVHVIDIDEEELRKYQADGYETSLMDLAELPKLLDRLVAPRPTDAWLDYVGEMKERFFGRDIGALSQHQGQMSPYAAVRRINGIIDRDAIVVADTGATVCWVHQTFHRGEHLLMTAGGHSPMGYALPAAIGAAIRASHRQVICCIGDGGFQLNIQELQTVRYYELDIKIVIFDNQGYGIIKQFQDSYLANRYEASGRGYGVPNLAKIAEAYDLGYASIDKVEDIRAELFTKKGARLIHLRLHPDTRIEPKLEMGRPIQDQYPYLSDSEFEALNRFVAFERS
jgi:acetolactate synthase-1/2/3 large subunit